MPTTPKRLDSDVYILSRAFAALGHTTKLRILKYVIDDRNPPVVPTMAANELDLTVPVVAYSLKKLHEVGLLDRRVSGRYSFYSVNTKFLTTLKEFLQ